MDLKNPAFPYFLQGYLSTRMSCSVNFSTECGSKFIIKPVIIIYSRKHCSEILEVIKDHFDLKVKIFIPTSNASPQLHIGSKKDIYSILDFIQDSIILDDKFSNRLDEFRRLCNFRWISHGKPTIDMVIHVLIWRKGSMFDNNKSNNKMEDLVVLKNFLNYFGYEKFDEDIKYLSPKCKKYFESLGGKESVLSISI